jgi:aminocarboxymuconate-semialdehyde decarboxylase
MDRPMLFQCKVCGPATDHGSAPSRSRSTKRWRTIDIHCHCMVPEANAMVLKATGIPGGGETPNANAHVNDLTKSIAQQRGKIDLPKLTDLETRLSDMDQLEIDVQVISPYPGHFVYAAPPEVARDSARIVNDHIAGLVAKHPDRLMGMGTVPLQDPGMAIAELERTIGELGFRGVELSTNVRGADHIMLGTDYPFDMAEPDPVGYLSRVKGVSEKDMPLVAGGNAERLLGLSAKAKSRA